MIRNITVTGQLIILSPNLIIFTYPLGDLSLAAGLLRSMEFITYLFCQKKNYTYVLREFDAGSDKQQILLSSSFALKYSGNPFVESIFCKHWFRIQSGPLFRFCCRVLMYFIRALEVSECTKVGCNSFAFRFRAWRFTGTIFINKVVITWFARLDQFFDHEATASRF